MNPSVYCQRAAHGCLFACALLLIVQQSNAQANTHYGDNSGSGGTGNSNSFFGYSAGQANTSGSANSFVGRDAGFSNTTGGSNAFFGDAAGAFNTTGTENTFLGRRSGYFNQGSS